MIGGRRFKRMRDGRFALRLPADERDLLRSLPGQLRELLADRDDPSLLRLFPTAYADDPEREAEYRRYMEDDLRSRHVEALDVLERTVDADRVEEAELDAWVRALNELRLVLGTRLDVSEDMPMVDPDEHDAPAFALYAYLSWLQEQVVDALSP